MRVHLPTKTRTTSKCVQRTLHGCAKQTLSNLWKKSAHGGFHHQFDGLLGSMGVAAIGADAMKSVYYKVEEKPGHEAHNRNVHGPVVVSAMYRSGLLGQCTMKQVQVLWDLTCVGGELDCYVFQFCVCVH